MLRHIILAETAGIVPMYGKVIWASCSFSILHCPMLTFTSLKVISLTSGDLRAVWPVVIPGKVLLLALLHGRMFNPLPQSQPFPYRYLAPNLWPTSAPLLRICRLYSPTMVMTIPMSPFSTAPPMAEPIQVPGIPD